MSDLFEKLCLASGVSGFEEEVLKIIQEEVYDFASEMYYDKIGNLIVKKNGRKTPEKKVLFSCHADEVGFVINNINSDGTLSFDSIGMDCKIMPGKRVLIGKDKIPGVIAAKPAHLIPKDEKNKEIPCDKLYIDIGAKSKEEAECKNVYASFSVFVPEFIRAGSRIISKAIDDRIGCEILCGLIKQDLEYDTYFAFCTGEELGLRGSAAVAGNLKPDVCVVVESTTANDIYGVCGPNKVCTLGGGAVVPFIDGATFYDRDLHEKVLSLAKREKIAVQTKTKVAGGTDAASYQKGCSGAKVIGIALPARYIHTGACMSDIRDVENLKKLANALLQEIHSF